MRTYTVLHRNSIGKNSKIFSSKTTGPTSMKFVVNDLLVVPFHNTVFWQVYALMRTHTVINRNTKGKIQTFFSQTTGLILMKLGDNDLWVLPFHNTVFLWAYLNQCSNEDSHFNVIGRSAERYQAHLGLLFLCPRREAYSFRTVCPSLKPDYMNLTTSKHSVWLQHPRDSNRVP